MRNTAKFNIGDLVVHKRQGYRGVIIDVDPVFQFSGRYKHQAFTQDFSKQNPWYRLLIDESNLMTYVKESLLTPDFSQQRINNPKLHFYLLDHHGIYRTISQHH
jgi:heat shock protein HspQ